MNFIEIAYGSEGAVETAEKTKEGVLGSLGINGQLFVFQLINFAVVAAILWFLILKPLTKKMAERQKIIDEGLNNASKMNILLKETEEEKKKSLKIAKDEAEQIIISAENIAKSQKEKIVAKTKAQVEQIAEAAKKQIFEEKEKMIKEVKTEVAALIVLSMEKILNEKITSTKDKELIEKTLKEISKL